MDDREDPSTLLFGSETVDLYSVLSLKSDASADDLKKAYRKLALVHHPDRHASKTDEERAAASLKFQQVGFAYAILSDEKRRARYDKTGRTDEGFEGVGEEGWETYFADLFDQVTKAKLDEMKAEYQGSAEELEDLKAAYTETDGSIEDIMNHIPHSTHNDEARFIIAIQGLIASGELSELTAWEASTKDEKARLVRKKQAEKEAGEAEELARELGVWDEFYGSGKTGARKGRGKSTAKATEVDEEEGDVSALQALILKKQKSRGGFLDNLAAKYAEAGPKGKGKGKRKGRTAEDEEGVEESPRKKRGTALEPPELDDEEFEKLQKKLFADKAKPGSGEGGKAKKAGKARRGK
ncbi:hypothetical protein K488DRAFT_87409 [Vararia minispora EC-137]|uniref:Uncharacterized protein n=1 Tax=Vararia minispora EC-137 TaxID=1314806 RepID=A0ACB8QG91_9AGAM|nr:hypothetical protein K488DRAFT_87409 [Vararia minispora EC-137]